MKSVDNGRLRLRAEEHEGALCVNFDIRDANGEWMVLLANGLVTRFPNFFSSIKKLVCPDPVLEWKASDLESPLKLAEGVFREAAVAEEGRSLVVRGRSECHAVEMALRLAGPNHVAVRVTDRLEGDPAKVRLGRLMTQLFFVPHGRGSRTVESPDLVWMPNIHASEDGVCGDTFFRSPALIVFEEGHYAVLIPDLDVFAENRAMQHALDFRVFNTLPIEAPRLSYGFCPYTERAELDAGHTYTRHPADLTMAVRGREFSYAFDLFLGRAESKGEVVRVATEFLWQRYGRRFFADVRPQVLPFEEYGRRYTYVHELPDSLATVTINGQPCAGINNVSRRGAQFHGWENDFQTAFGAKHYGGKWADAKLSATADGIVSLIHQAPRNHGAFPCLYHFAENRFEGSVFFTSWAVDWLNGYDNAGMGVSAWWLLYWHEHFGAPLDLVKEYAQFLVATQLPSGAIPTWFNADLSPAKPLRESATTAICGAVLAKLAKLTGDGNLRAAAVRAGRFIVERIVPGLAFQDFETFYSCSYKPLHAMDYWSGIKPHTNLSLQWACDQMLALYRLTGEAEWLAQGEYLIGVLSLYQQVWKPAHYQEYLFGGFGVMNTDGEWNDARQGRFITTYTDYYFSTGNAEYLERAVAAARSVFALMDMEENHRNDINRQVLGENLDPCCIAHGRAKPGQGYSGENIHHCGPAGDYSMWTGTTWGPGGGLGGTAYLERLCGALWVDMAAKTATPIDGLRVKSAAWTGTSLDLAIESALADLPHPYRERRQIFVRFGSIPAGGLSVKINGKDYGRLAASALAGGVAVTL